MNNHPQDFRAAIDLWPSLEAFAADIGVPPNTAKQMRRRNSVNQRYWKAMIEGAAARDVPCITERLLIDLSAPSEAAQ